MPIGAQQSQMGSLRTEGMQEQEVGIGDGRHVQAGRSKKWGLMMGDMCKQVGVQGGR